MCAVSANNTEHYTWGDACDGWHLLAGDDLSVIEERMPPGTGEQRHRHMRSRQFFHVLDGEAALELQDNVHRLHRGEGARAARRRAPDAQRQCSRRALPCGFFAQKSRRSRLGLAARAPSEAR